MRVSLGLVSSESFHDGDYSLAASGPSRDENPRAKEASFSAGSSEISLSRQPELLPPALERASTSLSSGLCNRGEKGAMHSLLLTGA